MDCLEGVKISSFKVCWTELPDCPAYSSLDRFGGGGFRKSQIFKKWSWFLSSLTAGLRVPEGRQMVQYLIYCFRMLRQHLLSEPTVRGAHSCCLYSSFSWLEVMGSPQTHCQVISQSPGLLRVLAGESAGASCCANWAPPHPPVMDFTPERLFLVVQFLSVPNGIFCLLLQFTELDGAAGFMLCSIDTSCPCKHCCQQ